LKFISNVTLGLLCKKKANKLMNPSFKNHDFLIFF